MNSFGFYEPTSVRKAVAIAADHSDGKYVAGGQTLLAAMKLGLTAPTDLIDLGKIPELATLAYDKGSDSIRATIATASIGTRTVGPLEATPGFTPSKGVESM